jgi:hypothetical protein
MLSCGQRLPVLALNQRIGGFSLMWIAYALRAICPRFRDEFTHAAVRNHRDIPSHPHSARSIATGSIRTA